MLSRTGTGWHRVPHEHGLVQLAVLCNHERPTESCQLFARALTGSRFGRLQLTSKYRGSFFHHHMPAQREFYIFSRARSFPPPLPAPHFRHFLHCISHLQTFCPPDQPALVVNLQLLQCFPCLGCFLFCFVRRIRTEDA